MEQGDEKSALGPEGRGATALRLVLSHSSYRNVTEGGTCVFVNMGMELWDNPLSAFHAIRGFSLLDNNGQSSIIP